MPVSEIRELIMPYDSKLIRYGSKGRCVRRHLFGLENIIGNHFRKIGAVLNEEEIDLVVPIASGGFEPAVLAADYLEVDTILPVRYSSYRCKDGGVLIPCNSHLEYITQIRNKRVMIIDDMSATGTTAEAVATWMDNYSPHKMLFTFIIGWGINL